MVYGDERCMSHDWHWVDDRVDHWGDNARWVDHRVDHRVDHGVDDWNGMDHRYGVDQGGNYAGAGESDHGEENSLK